ncbi:zf-HC2 domain-containing protein [Tunicatimonas pelagia]|uniref:zf-HC2 domain-containing protein n=1 Tax=Tunicatimonas pelagia TaxID=931531 RepID=UPI002665D696|nr:zf-HC2 domain-containing protein [Tunicatimonas pelagia]WKN41497.1 zf-HC2 domain-containing protein [Tunicatimonas pelagia]
MNNNRKTTEFSTHLSRSRMRRYLHGQLSAEESRQVEVHLANCTHCSAALVNYIEIEEADQYNAYAKQLSGKLKEQKIAKRSTLSSFQIKAIRTAAAVVTLMIFSFFGVKNIINKEVANYQSDEVGLPVKGKPLAAKAVPVNKEVATKPTEKKDDNRLADNRPVEKKIERATTNKPSAPVKKKPIAKKVTPAVKKTTTKPQVKADKPTAPVEKKVATAVPKEKEPERESSPVEKVADTNKVTEPIVEKVEADSQLATQPEVKPIKSLSTVKKMDVAKQVDISTPVGSTAPPVIPVPGGGQR